MSNTKGKDLVPFAQKGTFVAKYGDPDEIRAQMDIMRAGVSSLQQRKGRYENGQWIELSDYTVSDAEVLALYIAAKNSKLSPAKGEIGIIPGSGVYVATSIKFGDALDYAKRFGDPLDVQSRPLYPNDPLWASYQAEYGLAAGDTVALIEVTSEVKRKAWYLARQAKIRELKEAGFEREELIAMVDAALGAKAPVMRSIGVVKATEKFSESKFKPRNAQEQEKADVKAANKEAVYSRYDRAMKRGRARFLTQHGYSTRDTRDYGGIEVVEEPDRIDQVGAVMAGGAANVVIDAQTRPAAKNIDIFGSGADVPLVPDEPVKAQNKVIYPEVPPDPAEEAEAELGQGALPLSDPPKKKIKTPEEVKAAANTALAWADNVGKGFAKQHYAQAQQMMDAADWKLPKGMDMPAAFAEFKKFCAAQIAPAPEAAK